MFKAEIIADSKNEFGNRLTTFIVTFPRIILAEFNTHRMLSRNSASSRAIPFEKMLKSVKENPFIPIKWMKEHKGMQGVEYFPKEWTKDLNERWLTVRDSAIHYAQTMSNVGVSKQICNRLLEPFMWHTVIVTASEWENFFALRVHEAAEIHIQKIAGMMLDKYNKSIPKELKAGEWHIPFGDKMDRKEIELILCKESNKYNEFTPELLNSIKIKIATARCARVSYTVVGEEDKKDNYENDIKLHDRLLQMGHLSPFEHCGRAMSNGEFDSSFHKGFEGDGPEFYTNGWSGNFRGFIQYRKILKGENKQDSRVIKK